MDGLRISVKRIKYFFGFVLLSDLFFLNLFSELFAYVAPVILMYPLLIFIPSQITMAVGVPHRMPIKERNNVSMNVIDKEYHWITNSLEIDTHQCKHEYC